MPVGAATHGTGNGTGGPPGTVDEYPALELVPVGKRRKRGTADKVRGESSGRSVKVYSPPEVKFGEQVKNSRHYHGCGDETARCAHEDSGCAFAHARLVQAHRSEAEYVYAGEEGGAGGNLAEIIVEAAGLGEKIQVGAGVKCQHKKDRIHQYQPVER